MAKDIARLMHILGVGERAIVARDQLTDCVVSLPLCQVDYEPTEDGMHQVTIPLWLAADVGIA